MIISLVTQKGGAGKTTAAINLACALRARDVDVVLVDLDPQRSVQVWSDIAAEHKREHPPVLAPASPDPATLYDHLLAYEQQHAAVIVDTPPHTGPVLRVACLAADVALIVTRPSPVDLAALGATLEVVAEAQAQAAALQVALLINGANSTVVARRARQSLEASEFTLLDVELGDRIAYQEAYAAGQGVVDYAPRSKAAREIRGLLREVLDLLREE